jgi:hypothetical protein
MRLSMEIRRNEGGHFEGTVTGEGDAPVAFSGTLELLKVLDDAADRAAPRPGMAD